MNELALFAGAGGGILGGKLLGWRTVCAVEWDQYAATVLAQRQNDGHLEAFPIWDDVQTFDGRPWRGIVDVISGGFPCQDISVAGKGAGIDGEKSGMWRHMARIIGEVRPRFVFVENSPNLIRNGLARVLGDLVSMGYDARWGIIGADDVGAPHRRKRIWILANAMPSGERRIARESEIEGNALAEANSPQRKGAGFTGRSYQKNANAYPRSAWWRQDPAEIPESRMGRMADGVAEIVDKNSELAYTMNHERKQLFKTSTKKNEALKNLSNVQREQEQAASTPQGQRQIEQHDGEFIESLPIMPQRHSRTSWGLGAWQNAIARSEVQDLREIVYASALSRQQKEFLVWFGAMRGGEWGAECLEALGSSPRVANGIKSRVDRLKAIGNGQVPSVAALAWRILSETL